MIGKTISHYKILEKLGEGGMGVVYKAEDMKLDRLVALKFLPSHLVDDEKALKRLLKEAKAASKINHPNVCTIHAIEEFEDTHFIVMEFVDGMTLKAKAKKEKLGIDEAVEYSIQIGKALKAAHDKDIIHRDIKSENIMINNENMVKVMDFGLAKLKDEAGLTKTGTAGTIAYMAPEQLQGFEIDTRTDIWSFGVVMYEMLTGQLPFKGEYESAMMYSIVNVEPEPMKDVPEELEKTVCKALVKNLDSRYQNIDELLQELKKMPSSVAISEKQEKSIVVLPFVNMSPDPKQEYFSDGLTEEIITDLSQIHTLRVISRTSAMMLKGTKKSINKISQELKVQYVLEGSVRKAGNNLRITAQLIDSINDKHLWAEKYSGTLDDVFDIQEKVSRKIVDALKLKLSPEENESLAERSIDNVAAYKYYLKANEEITKFSEDTINNALRNLQHAIDIIGENALLYSSMAFAYWNLVNIGIKQEDYLIKSEEYAKKSLLVDPESSTAHFVLGFIDFFREKQLESIHHFKKALEVNRDEIFALAGIAHVYEFAGKISAAVPYCERLMQIDPLSVPANWYKGGLYYYDGKFNLALQSWRKFYELHPENTLSLFMYAVILIYNNEIDEAITIIDQNAKTDPGNVVAKLGLILKYAIQGDEEKVFREMTPDFKKTCQRDLGFSHHISGIFAMLDVKDEALNWLENAVNFGFINYPFLNEYDPFLKNIRGEERFKKLMERVKYEWENFEV